MENRVFREKKGILFLSKSAQPECKLSPTENLPNGKPSMCLSSFLKRLQTLSNFDKTAPSSAAVYNSYLPPAPPPSLPPSLLPARERSCLVIGSTALSEAGRMDELESQLKSERSSCCEDRPRKNTVAKLNAVAATVASSTDGLPVEHLFFLFLYTVL